LLWFIVFLTPHLLRGADFANYLEHRLYLPVMGFLMAVQEAGALQRAGRSITVRTIAALVLILFGIQTINHSRVFANDLSFWQSAVSTSPHSYFAHTVMGQRYAAGNNPEQAEYHLRKALELKPGDPNLENDLGLVLTGLGKLAPAETLFLRALKADPGQPDVHKNLGNIYLKQNSLVQAESEFRKSLALAPEDPEVNDRLAMICYLQKRYPEAVHYHDQALKNGLAPDPRIQKLLAPYRKSQ
jgi:tetratricopeptide (TPR) repeat protein